MTFHEMFREALTCKNKADATAWLERNAETPAEQEQLRTDLAYFAMYYDWPTREKIYELFDAAHPIFGHKPVTDEEAEAVLRGADRNRNKAPRFA